jgi:hypothetical protein
MIDPRDAAILENLLHREGRSLLQYIGEAFPWVQTGSDLFLAQVQKLIAEERDSLGVLSRFLVRRRHTVPHLGCYPMAFVSLNFVSLDFLLPRLAAHQRQALTTLEQDLAALTDPEAQAEVEKILRMKKVHLCTLEKLGQEGGAVPTGGANI